MTGGGCRTLTSVSLHHHGDPETVNNRSMELVLSL